MGLGMETNSHNLGWFQESVVEFEIVTAQSPPQVIKINRQNDPDVFYTLAHSVGTLGFLVSVKVQLTHTKPYVRMHYIMTKSAKELQDTMTRLSEADDQQKKAGPCTRTGSARPPQGHGKKGIPTQFLEATAYSKDTAVVQCG